MDLVFCECIRHFILNLEREKREKQIKDKEKAEKNNPSHVYHNKYPM